MLKPSYQISAESINLIAEISEQIGILETLTGRTPEIHDEQFDPFSEYDLLRSSFLILPLCLL